MDTPTLTDLIAACTPEVWTTLIRSGRLAEIEALAEDPQWHTQALAAAAWCFFFPRPAHLAADLASARAALTVLDDADEQEEGPGALRLPFPVTSPAALAALGATWGWDAAAIKALLAEEAYQAPDGSLRLFPWYREQDDEQRPLALADAERLGIPLPDRFLDEPYESRWYLDRSGAALLKEALGDTAGLAVARVPAWPTPVDSDAEVASVCYQRLRERSRRVRYEMTYRRDDEGWLAACRKSIARLLDDYTRAVVSGGDRAVLRDDEDFRRPLEPPRWDSDYQDRTLSDLRLLTDDTLLLELGCWLVRVDLTGAVLGVFPNQTSLHHVSASNLVLTSCAYGDWHVLDLDRGAWLEGVTLDALLEDDALDAGLVPMMAWPQGESCDPDELDRSKYVYFTPDHKHYIAWFRHRGAGLLRAADHRRVTSNERIDRLFEHPPGGGEVPALLEPDAATATSVVIRGVRFTQRDRAESGWVSEKANSAVVRRGTSWRIYTSGVVYDDGRPVLRFGVPVFAAAFDRSGERLAVVGRRAVHIVRLDPEPALVKSLPLGPIRARVPTT